jgi:hypothetical protein
MEAREACLRAYEAQTDAETAFSQAAEAYSLAEREYRVELAKKTATLRSQGMAATLIPDLAKGDEKVAGLKAERDLAHALMEAATHSTWKHNNMAKTSMRLLEWSMAVATGRAMD